MFKRRSRKSRPNTRPLRFEQLSQRRLLAADCFHNATYPEDVNQDSVVTPVDALMVIRNLMGGGGRSGGAEGEPGNPSSFMDVNNDQKVTPVDALMVIQELLNPAGPQAAAGQEAAESEIEFEAALSSTTSAATGEAEFSSESENGTTKTEFEVELKGADPDVTYDVTVDGVVVGQVITDANGDGSVAFSDSPEGSELALPADFPAIAEGSAVDVGGVLTGTFAVPAEDEDDDADEENDDDDTDEDDDASEQDNDAATSVPTGGTQAAGAGVSANASSGTGSVTAGASGAGAAGAAGTDVELSATLTGPAGIQGKAEFESEMEDGVMETEFEVEIRGADPNATYDVFVDGTVVGQIQTNSRGRGKLEFSNEVDDDGQPFPTGFPSISDGSTITVGSILSGTMAVEQEDDDDDD